MAEKDYKICIVEGEAREPLIINNIINVFFSHMNVKIIVLPAGQNIYMLWKKLRDDDFNTDIIEVLREDHEEIRKQLNEINREECSEIYLFFDYDVHQNNLKCFDDAPEMVLTQMLQSFDNETENGKLYISYPMVEALRDFEDGICGRKINCFVSIDDFTEYKRTSASRSLYPQIRNYDISTWRKLIEVFALRLSCLMKRSETLVYNEYMEKVTPLSIFELEIKELLSDRVFVLSAFPEFLLDYFGIKLWKTAVKRPSNSFKYCRKLWQQLLYM